MSEFWKFMGEHFIIGPLTLITIIGWLVNLVNRFCRVINIALRGWPTMPLMDADGDIVHPKNE